MANMTQDNTCYDYCSFMPFCADEKTQQARLPVKRQFHLKKKEALDLPKNKFQNLYAIQNGALKTYHIEADGKELIRGFYFSGEILGYEAIYAGQYCFSAIALTDTIVCEISYDSFIALTQSKPALQKHAMYLISKELNTGSYLASVTAEQRFAAFLLDLTVRLHPLKPQINFDIPMTRQDIGNYLGLTPETISRMMTRLQKKNIITIHHKKIQITQLEALKKIASGIELT